MESKQQQKVHVTYKLYLVHKQGLLNVGASPLLSFWIVSDLREVELGNKEAGGGAIQSAFSVQGLSSSLRWLSLQPQEEGTTP